MKKGMDHIQVQQIVVRNATGIVEHAEDPFWMRPPWGEKELKRRRKANKVARASRRRNRACSHR